MVTHSKRVLSWLLGAAALAVLTYSVTRRSLQRRAAADAAASAASESSVANSGKLASSEPPQPWEELDLRPSTPDALDIALDLEGVFDATSEAPEATVHFADRVPVALSGDDQEPPAPEDLGRAWLLNATQSELGVSEADLATDLDNLLPRLSETDVLAESGAPLEDGDGEEASESAGRASSASRA